MEKTIREWLKEYLTEEQFKNAEKHNSQYLEVNSSSLSGAIYYGFWWVDTPEGFKYWNEVYQKLYAEGK